jgi:hypothetical protein
MTAVMENKVSYGERRSWETMLVGEMGITFLSLG